jgi:hypothetical protein
MHMASEKRFIRPSQIGRSPTANGTKGTDAGFYEWISGADPEKALADTLLWLIDDLKEERDPETLRQLIEDWRLRCEQAEFFARIEALHKLFSPDHPLQAIIAQYRGR